MNLTITHITLDWLRSEGACPDALKKFEKDYPNGVELTPEAVEAMSGYNIDWLARRVLTAPAWAKYERVRDAAWAKYERLRRAALAECRRVSGAAWAKYERVRDAAWAEYECVRDAALIAAAWGRCEVNQEQPMKDLLKHYTPTEIERALDKIADEAMAEQVRRTTDSTVRRLTTNTERGTVSTNVDIVVETKPCK